MTATTLRLSADAECEAAEQYAHRLYVAAQTAAREERADQFCDAERLRCLLALSAEAEALTTDLHYASEVKPWMRGEVGILALSLASWGVTV
jgi:hypothetical protein